MSHLIGLLLNLFAGLILWLFVNKLFDWLPTFALLHEKFASVKREKDANKKIVELTSLVFFAFFWLFAGNMLWILLTVIIEILNFPDLIIYT